jgi:hypothetical protein
MIDMGNITLCQNHNDCPGIAIEHVTLDGYNQSYVNGIVNNNGQELSYVDDVQFYRIAGMALELNTYSWNSGPYTNLTMSSVGTCVDINGSFDTRGIHGLNCNTKGTSPAAIYVDGSNNSLEDISLVGATGSANGILIGDSAAAHNNVLFNISGTGFQNLVTISNQPNPSGPPYPTNCPGQAQNNYSLHYACDITIMGVKNGSSGTNTINDEIGGATLTDSNLGMYILGEPVQSGSSSNPNNTFLGNSHFTTSPNWPTWVVGTSQTQGASCSSVGSLFSVTSGSGTTLWECESSVGWQPIK